ncbi:hypothetical protein LSH36_281g03066 [Paralvinella palmiformis]|uniref:JmjC domain-containing protein n=1 Tax=Paralvinella palmiformis TaxID=53620 RepID=A0AAD9JIQ6_9ANNE|nr:hypothetical protein LSH36_281g03066 [Paralvinella palmiformis]
MALVVVCFLVILVIFANVSKISVSEPNLYTYIPEELVNILEDGCFLGVNDRASREIVEIFLSLLQAFANERHVTIGRVNLENFQWPGGEHLKIDGIDCKSREFTEHSACIGPIPNVVFFAKTSIDRSCLLSPSYTKLRPRAAVISGRDLNLETLVEYVNGKCQTFRTVDGGLLPAGRQKQYIVDNVFNVSNVSNVTMEMLYDRGGVLDLAFTQGFLSDRSSHRTCQKEGCMVNERAREEEGGGGYLEILQCKIINSDDIGPEEFFHEYIKQSRPVIIKNAVVNWPAWHKWSQEYLWEKYGNKTVHVKLTPGGDFEGVERAELWEDYEQFVIPDTVMKKLPYPDLVVVRPAGLNVKFSDFLNLITKAAQQSIRNVSAYLEYSSIREYMPELLSDIEEFAFVKDKLTLRHLNMWLSDGNTVGRLHFDPFDNFLCQLRGKKQLLLFEPFNNSRLYEGHIPQATLHYNHSDQSFRRKTLEDSTSMVMSPIDLFKPDLKRFPNFKSARPLTCTIDEGDALFMPAFWWHEVYSYPNVVEKRNLAVNFWYEPFLLKEFPCPECKMDVNPYYFHLLY